MARGDGDLKVGDDLQFTSSRTAMRDGRTAVRTQPNPTKGTVVDGITVPWENHVARHLMEEGRGLRREVKLSKIIVNRCAEPQIEKLIHVCFSSFFVGCAKARLERFSCRVRPGGR